MDQLLLKIVQLKYFRWPAGIASIIMASVVVYYATIPDKVIFPNLESYGIECYTDKANGGNSQVLDYIESDSIISLEFRLQDGFSSPYVGLSITPLFDEYIRAESYNQINLCILGENIDRVGISIYTEPSGFLKQINQKEALYHSYLNISNQLETYHIKVKQLQHPEWWEDVNHIPETLKDRPDLNKILHINISSAFSPLIDQKKTLEIYSITFTRNNQKLFLTLGLIYIVSILLLFAILYLTSHVNAKDHKVTISYKPLETTNKKTGIEECIKFINNNYSDSNLTLEKISEETSMTPRRITSIINDQFDCNFKTYLNRIRIAESKRFLTETDLNIGEIAFKVGFNSQSHFNRVFKNELQISPTEYRESLKS